MISVPNVYGERAIRVAYGDPRDPKFQKDMIVRLNLPFDLYLDWGNRDIVHSIRVHKDVVESLLDALKEVEELVGAEKIHEDGWDHFGGAYFLRNKKGGHELSCHSWGIAIDLNPHLAPWLKKSNQPKVFVEAFEKRGWTWGGRWKNVDGMHFQAAKGY